MRIADVSAFYAPAGGGVRTYVERKLAYADRAGVELAVIVPGAENRIERRGPRTRLIHLASPRLILDRRYRYFAQAEPVHAILDALAPDLVEASSPWRTASIVAGWRGHAPRALIMHADPLAAYAYRWFDGVAPRPAIDRGFDWFWAHLRRTAAAYDLVATPNPGFTRRLAERGIGHAVSLPLGVEAETFSPIFRDEALRAEMLARCSLGPEASLLLGIGRFAAEKRWRTVIEAAALAGTHRPIGLVLIGEGRGRAALERAIAGNPHIRLHAPIRDRARLARVMASGDALVHGCEAETFGLVAAEAAASGLPIVAPDEGGAAAQADAACSALYPAGDAQAARDAIVALLARPRLPLRQAAAAAAARVPTIEAHFDALFRRYQSLIAKPALAA